MNSTGDEMKQWKAQKNKNPWMHIWIWEKSYKQVVEKLCAIKITMMKKTTIPCRMVECEYDLLKMYSAVFFSFLVWMFSVVRSRSYLAAKYSSYKMLCDMRFFFSKLWREKKAESHVFCFVSTDFLILFVFIRNFSSTLPKYSQVTMNDLSVGLRMCDACVRVILMNV